MLSDPSYTWKQRNTSERILCGTVGKTLCMHTMGAREMIYNGWGGVFAAFVGLISKLELLDT